MPKIIRAIGRIFGGANTRLHVASYTKQITLNKGNIIMKKYLILTAALALVSVPALAQKNEAEDSKGDDTYIAILFGNAEADDDSYHDPDIGFITIGESNTIDFRMGTMLTPSIGLEGFYMQTAGGHDYTAHNLGSYGIDVDIGKVEGYHAGGAVRYRHLVTNTMAVGARAGIFHWESKFEDKLGLGINQSTDGNDYLLGLSAELMVNDSIGLITSYDKFYGNGGGETDINKLP